MTHGKTYNKSPRRINHKATRSKTNTGTTALERSVEQTTGGFKALLQLANFTLGNPQNKVLIWKCLLAVWSLTASHKPSKPKYDNLTKSERSALYDLQ